MPDREKVIRGLEKIRNDLGYGLPDRSNVVMEYLNSLTDAIVLLKEQEPVEPRIQTSSSGVTWWNVCGNCQTAINPNDKYCHECGRPVKLG